MDTHLDTHFFSKETKQKLVYAAGLLVQKKQKLARKLEEGKKSIETYIDIFPRRIKNVQDVIRSLINACNEEPNPNPFQVQSEAGVVCTRKRRHSAF